jgi:iron(III) transport system substrate-binding protein
MADRLGRQPWYFNWRRLTVYGGTLALSLLALTGVVAAQGTLIMYCGVDENWCRAMTNEYQKQTGINVRMTRMSAGEIYARLRAEKENPQADIWWGGTGDPHLQAAEEGLTEEYKSDTLPKLREWAQKQAQRSKYRTVGIYLGALGFGYNTEEIASRKLTPPACWADLIKPEFKGEVQMADPNSSGTAWTALATLVQLMGEEPAFVYLRKLNANINEYTKAGAAPAQAAGLGETVIGIAFQHDVIDVAIRGKPVQVVSPCEGTGYEIGSMSIVKSGKNGGEARTFYEWALTAGAQKLGAANRSYQVPSNADAPIPPQAPDLSKIKLIDYDFGKYGSSEERKRLLARWTTEVKSAPK